MYLGEASLEFENINDFLSVASSLQMKELPINIEERKVKDEPNNETAIDMVTQTESSKSQGGKNPASFSDWKILVRDLLGEGGICKPCEKYYAEVKQHVKIKRCKVKYKCLKTGGEKIN